MLHRTPGSEAPVATARAALWRTLRRTLGFSCLFLVLLQVYRPFYFLADDNLVYWFPLVNALGARLSHGLSQGLSHGQSPFLDPNLFGGYDLLRDPTAISLWNPLVLGLSLLARTPFYVAIVDLFASANLLVSALGFTLLGCRLREWKGLSISDNRIVFLSLSFTFSAYALSIGACWGMFLANQAALPLLFLGLFAPRQKAGIGWVTAGVVYALLVGHLSPFLYTTFFLTLFSFGLCWSNRSWQPLGRWCAGVALALLITSPFLVPAAQGFLSSPRNASFRLGVASQSSVPFPALVAAYFGGYLGVLLVNGFGLFGRHLIFGLASCAANYQLLASGRKIRALSRLEVSLALLVGLIALFMARPHWLGTLISHVPLYRSLRWPFRELFLFLFLCHLWMLLRPVTLAPRALLRLSGLSIAVFFVSLAVVPPWTFSAMPIDRGLILSGQARSYWEQVRPLIGKGNRIFCVVSPEITAHHDKEIPYSLLGALNYPALFEVPSISGYTAQGFANPKVTGDEPYFFGGIYSSEVGARLLAKNAHLKEMRLRSLHPLRIDLCSRAGCQALPVPPTFSPPTFSLSTVPPIVPPQ